MSHTVHCYKDGIEIASLHSLSYLCLAFAVALFSEYKIDTWTWD